MPNNDYPLFGLDKRGFDSRAELQRIIASIFLPARNGAERGYFKEVFFMAVSLKKPYNVDLSKSESQKIREYTPKHLIDEEETIVKPPRQSPNQPQHIEDYSFEVFSEENELEAARINLKDFLRKYQYPFLISISIACLIVLVVLLIRTFSPAVHTFVENVPNMSVETSSYSAPVDSTPIESTPMNEDASLSSSLFGILFDTFLKLISHPAVIFMLGISFLLLSVKIVMKFTRY